MIEQKEYAIVTLDPNKEIFVNYIAFLNLRLKISIYPTWKAKIASLLAKKVTVLVKYLNFINVF